MQIDRTPDPIIRHSAVVVHRKKFRAVLEAFEKQIVIACERMIGSNTFEVTEENLLIQRKALAARIKKGMLARKDLEAEIAALAAIVWFLRLSKDRQDRITDGW